MSSPVLFSFDGFVRFLMQEEARSHLILLVQNPNFRGLNVAPRPPTPVSQSSTIDPNSAPATVASTPLVQAPADTKPQTFSQVPGAQMDVLQNDDSLPDTTHPNIPAYAYDSDSSDDLEFEIDQQAWVPKYKKNHPLIPLDKAFHASMISANAMKYEYHKIRKEDREEEKLERGELDEPRTPRPRYFGPWLKVNPDEPEMEYRVDGLRPLHSSPPFALKQIKSKRQPQKKLTKVIDKSWHKYHSDSLNEVVENEESERKRKGMGDPEEDEDDSSPQPPKKKLKKVSFTEMPTEVRTIPEEVTVDENYFQWRGLEPTDTCPEELYEYSNEDEPENADRLAQFSWEATPQNIPLEIRSTIQQAPVSLTPSTSPEAQSKWSNDVQEAVNTIREEAARMPSEAAETVKTFMETFQQFSRATIAQDVLEIYSTPRGPEHGELSSPPGPQQPWQPPPEVENLRLHEASKAYGFEATDLYPPESELANVTPPKTGLYVVGEPREENPLKRKAKGEAGAARPTKVTKTRQPNDMAIAEPARRSKRIQAKSGRIEDGSSSIIDGAAVPEPAAPAQELSSSSAPDVAPDTSPETAEAQTTTERLEVVQNSDQPMKLFPKLVSLLSQSKSRNEAREKNRARKLVLCRLP
ncbi:hypothetical protein PMIN07_009269 [Paraphaeosphaeria minitans]